MRKSAGSIAMCVLGYAKACSNHRVDASLTLVTHQRSVELTDLTSMIAPRMAESIVRIWGAGSDVSCRSYQFPVASSIDVKPRVLSMARESDIRYVAVKAA